MCSWTIYTTCFGLPAQPRYHQDVRRRLALLPAWASDDYDELRAMAAQLYWVYRQCCDVLHGLRAYTDLAQSLVAAWEKIVVEGEETVTTRSGDQFQSVPESTPRTPHWSGVET